MKTKTTESGRPIYERSETAPEVPSAKIVERFRQQAETITDDITESYTEEEQAELRKMSLPQWRALQYLATQKAENIAWIDANFFAEDGVLYTRQEIIGLDRDCPLPRDLETRVALSRIRGEETRQKTEI